MRTKRLKTFVGAALVLTAMALAPTVQAACVADTSLDAARWVFRHHYYFYQQRTDEAAAMLSVELRQGMETQWRCVPAEGNCPLVADPWTNAGDGRVEDPVVFSLRTSPPERSRIGMRFLLARGDDSGTPATVELVMVRDAASGCFVLDELVGAAGESLRNALSLPGR